jgi:predicted flap endonuclease-1-like 5' DNA nuclease
MNYLFWILVGIIVGWVIEWVIDWLFWRKPDGRTQEKLAAAEAENQRLQAQLAAQEPKPAASGQAGDIYQAKLAYAEKTVEQLQAELNAVSSQAPQEEDLFERIRGVWTDFAERLHDGGIFTFAQLAETKPERLREIVRPEEWHEIQPDNWVGQAREFAQEKAEASARILAEHREREQLQERLAELEADNGRLQALVAGGVGATLAGVEAPTRPAPVTDLEATLVQTRPVRRDSLVDIEGIGPVYAQRLNSAGIFSFRQLAEQSPERLREIINPEAWQKIDFADWIAQAKAMADPDPLEDIVGIGEIYARRLNDAGIYTFAQLAALSPERIEQIAEVDKPQMIDAKSWIAQARGFAFKKTQATRALGSRAVPQDEDPLVDIDGVGPVYAERLKRAGIVSFWQLANMTPEQVREVIGPEEWQKVDAASWIAQAKAMASPDRLEDITGIGVVFARRLNEAGIYTFAQLAGQTPERLWKIIKPESWQKIEPEKWIAEAGEFAAKKSDHLAPGA